MKISVKQLLGFGLLVMLGVLIMVIFIRGQPIEVVTVERTKEIPIEVFGLGTIEARVLSRVGFAVPGTLKQVYADHGDRVAAGESLAELDSAAQAARVSKAQAAVQQAEAALARSEAQVGRAEALLAQRQQTRQRQDALVNKGTVSAETAEDARTAEQVALADLNVARQDLAVAAAVITDARAQREIEQVQLAQHTLNAPYDALVVERLREPGEVFNPGEAMFTLIEPSSVWGLAYIDETQAGGLAPGQSARVRLRSLPRLEFSAEISRIGIESDRVSEERRVYLRCTHCPEQFHLGEQIEVIITKRIARDILLVPQLAVLGLDGADGWLWLVDKGRLKKQVVRLGDRTLDGRIEVLSGLDAGTRVVVSPVPSLRDGARVRPVQKDVQ